LKKKKFNIGIDARMYGPQQTGIGTYIESLIQNLSTYDNQNRYFIFLLPHNLKKITLPAANFFKVPTYYHWYGLKEQTLFLKQLLFKNLDLIHFTHFNLPILYPKRFIVTIHDITPRFFPGNKMGKKWWRRQAYNLIVQKGIQRSCFTIVPSKKTKLDLVNFYQGNKDNIKVIYEGIKDKESLAERKLFLENYSQRKEITLQKLKSQFGFTQLKKPYIFYTGVWRNHKNIVNLIKAFDILVKEKKFKGDLVLGGNKDPYYPEVDIIINKLGLANRVINPGFLLGEKLNLFYQAADVFVLPSLYEGFGLVTLEALNQGTAVACSNIEPLKEILQDAALYFNPQNYREMAEKIYGLMQDKRLQKKLLKNSQNILGKYDWRIMAQKTHQIYMKVLEKN
jgi:glycosyltransferase involved in cell wall biosynthesis